MKRKKKTGREMVQPPARGAALRVFGTGTILLGLLVFGDGMRGADADSNISAISPDHFAWSENAGWLNFRPQGGAYGVTVHSGCLSGDLWAENIGYVRLRAPAVTTCQDIHNDAADNYGVTVDGSGYCAGYGWSENVGWVNFSPSCSAPCGVIMRQEGSSRIFEGYAWAENVGFVHFQNADPAYEVQTPNGIQVSGSIDEAAKGYYAYCDEMNDRPRYCNPDGEMYFQPGSGSAALANRAQAVGDAWVLQSIPPGSFLYETDECTSELPIDCGNWPAGMALESSPTAVGLVRLSATRSPRAVTLLWETATEIDNVGFHIWRSEDGGENYFRITTSPIPAGGAAATGATYTHQDSDVVPRVAYAYKLEDIDSAGRSSFHGPVWAEAQPGWCGTMSRSGGFGYLSFLLLPVAMVIWLLRRRRKHEAC